MEGVNESEAFTLTTEILNGSTDNRHWNEYTAESLDFEVPFLLVVVVLATIGNIVVILIYRKKARRQSNSALYILNLAIGDLLAAVVALYQITEFYPSTWWILWRHDAQCILHRWLRYTGFDVTVFSMVAIAVDRYFAVCKPIKFKTNFTLKRTKRIIVMLWISAMLFAVHQSYNFQARYNGPNKPPLPSRRKFACKIFLPTADAWYIYFKSTYNNVLLFYLPVIITGFIYVIIITTVWKRQYGVARHSTSRNDNVHIRTARMLFIVYMAYASCYAFFGTYNLIKMSKKGNNLNPLVTNIGLLIPYLNSCLNPFIYSFSNSTFRKHLTQLFWKPYGKHQPRKPENSTIQTNDKTPTVKSCTRNDCNTFTGVQTPYRTETQTNSNCIIDGEVRVSDRDNSVASIQTEAN